jgi:hypothetical protein
MHNRRIFNRTICLIFPLALMLTCGPKQDSVDRIIEDGVEVVLNHLEPYVIKGEPTSLILEKEYTIDTESEEIVEIGLNDIWTFDVDSTGDIFILYRQGAENCIFRFNSGGEFVSSFGRTGEGPGEMQSPLSLQAINREIVISALGKILFYSREGEYLKEIPKKAAQIGVIVLENGNFLIRERIRDDTDYSVQHLGEILYDPDFHKLEEIVRVTAPSPYKGDGLRAIMPYLHSCGSGKEIYVGDSESGYEVRVFDIHGDLLRKIRKDNDPVPIGPEDRQQILKPFEGMREELKRRIYMPENFPPFQRMFFTDDSGRLFVMTYEKGQTPREYIYDIFNPDGIYISRIGLDNHGRIGVQVRPLPILSRNGFLYYVREKDSGFKELIVSKMVWQ